MELLRFSWICLDLLSCLLQFWSPVYWALRPSWIRKYLALWAHVWPCVNFLIPVAVWLNLRRTRSCSPCKHPWQFQQRENCASLFLANQRIFTDTEWWQNAILDAVWCSHFNNQREGSKINFNFCCFTLCFWCSISCFKVYLGTISLHLCQELPLLCAHGRVFHDWARPVEFVSGLPASHQIPSKTSGIPLDPTWSNLNSEWNLPGLAKAPVLPWGAKHGKDSVAHGMPG